MATGAQADELTALKAQLEALQSRVSQLESQPAPAVPAGTRLLTVRRGQGTYSNLAALPARERLQDHQGYTIAITPTADMPAPVSEVTVSGEIRARMIWDSVDIDGDDSNYIDLDADDGTETSEHVDAEDDDFSITTRARLRVDGRTETAIGEIGGTIRLEGTRDAVRDGGADDGGAGSGGDVSLNIGWGYWQMTPNFQLGAGYWDSLAAIQAGWDWNGEPSLVGLRAGPTNHSVSQVRLTYSSGGLTAAISLEDNDLNENWENDIDDFEKDAVFPTVAASLTFDAGSFLVSAAGAWQKDEDELNFVDTDIVCTALNVPCTTTSSPVFFNDTEDNWWIGAGAIIRLSDMFRLEGAAGIGEGYTSALYFPSQANENDAEYWAASILAVVSFAEAWRLELGAAMTSFDHEEDEAILEDNAVEDIWTVGASAFWDPVDQLTLGVGVGFSHAEADGADAEADFITAGFGAWFRF
jgi:hypothetical protein